MKRRLLVLLAVLVPVLSGCAGSLSTQSPSELGRFNIQSLDEVIYCATQNEEARQLYNKGVELANKGELESAIEAYRKATELDPRFCDAMDNLGQLYRRLNKLDEAATWYRRSIEVLPNNPAPYKNLGVVYIMQRKYDEAVSMHQMLITIAPDDPEGYYGLGTVYLEKDELQLALEHLQRAEQLYAKRSSPLITDAQYTLGVVYYGLEDFKQALHYFERVYDQKRDDPFLNYSLGLCHLSESKDTEEAKKYIERARRLGVKVPEDVAQQLNL
jgi:tetratricopeptide (TPR) repeat protein